jgi:hypothetical protein
MKLDSTTASDMPRLPAGMGPADGSYDDYDPDTPRQVFLAARCQRTGQPYLMRFARRDWDGRYEAIGAHKLEVLETDAGEYMPPIRSDMLDGVPDCPYCENEVAGQCPCGTLFCSSLTNRGPVTCPGCKATLDRGRPGSGGSFDVRRSMG